MSDDDVFGNNAEVSDSYSDWLRGLKDRVRSLQHHILLQANAELVGFYWELGKDIFEKQQHAHWGKSLVASVSKDLKAEFPNLSGFSPTNLYNCVKFYKFFSSSDFFQRSVGKIETETVFIQRSVGRLPWRHIIQLVNKTQTVEEDLF